MTFLLRSSAISVLFSFKFDTRLIEPHDIDLIYFGCGLIEQFAEAASVAMESHNHLGRHNPPSGDPNKHNWKNSTICTLG